MHFHTFLVYLAAVSCAFARSISSTRRQTDEEATADLAGLSVGDIINALGIGLVSHINVTITLETLVTNLVTVSFDIVNPLPIELTLDRIVTTAGINEVTYATFDYTFPEPIVVPIFGTANSGAVPDVLLTRGAIASLDIIPLGYLDLINVDAYIRAATIFGHLGLPITIEGLQQNNVSTSYDLSLGL